MPKPAMLSSPNVERVSDRLTRRTKLAYGMGEAARAVIQNIRVVFLLYFLTSVAGMDAALAGTVLLVGRIWDGINDPIVGWLGDRTRSRFGKRYPWMIIGAIPLGLFTFLQWVVPPFNSNSPDYQLQLFWYYLIIALLFDTAFTTVSVAYSALAPDLARDYDQRMSLTSFQMGFSILGGIGILLLAQLIFARIPNPTHQFLSVGVICAMIAVAAIFLSVWGTYRTTLTPLHEAPLPSSVASSPWAQVTAIFKQREFQLVTGIYVFSWASVQGMVAILPYFVQSWMQLPVQHVTQLVILMQVIALMSIPLWRSLSQRVGKRGILLLGLPAVIVSQIGLSLLQPGQIWLLYGCAIVIGIGVATVYLAPWSMLPDVIDLDELRYGQRRDGLFYSLMMQMQKFGLAISIFLLSQGLSWGGLVSATSGEKVLPVQPASVLPVIRLEIGMIPAIAMIITFVLAWCYPITQEHHQAIMLQLKEQRQGNLAAENVDRTRSDGSDGHQGDRAFKHHQ